MTSIRDYKKSELYNLGDLENELTPAHDPNAPILIIHNKNEVPSFFSRSRNMIMINEYPHVDSVGEIKVPLKVTFKIF